MLYEIRDGTVSAGGREILSHIDFEIRGNEKIGIVGKNGAGKTTLLRLIAGELALDRDDKRQGPGIRTARRAVVGFLRQTREEDQERTVAELLEMGLPEMELEPFSRERYLFETEYDRIFTGFGFRKEDKTKKISSFSGGEQTKIVLIRLLLQKPDILLLDEPTNHLDIKTVVWLEEYMKTYPKAVVFVSHDRFFLDQVTSVIYELRGGKLKRYPGNYTRYREQRQKEAARIRKAYEEQQQEVERLEALIERFRHKPRKASFIRSRKTILERMERMEKPLEDEIHIFTGDIEPQIPGNKWVMEAKELQIGYEKPLLSLSLRIRKGQKIGIIGENGTGKTTFLRTAAGLLSPLAGSCILGERTVTGYFDQNSAEISSTKTVAEHYHELFPVLTDKEVRQILGAYLFRGKDAGTRVDSLSGGEKARLVLCELLSARPNFLILDEPTNHMDIQAKETLESAFSAYRGTILFVSHDRYFIRQVADSVLVFENGEAHYYPFGYEHYLERRRKAAQGTVPGLIRAEDKALLEEFRSVPEKEKHRLREISTEESWYDWRISLAEEQMQQAREKAAALLEKRERERENDYLQTIIRGRKENSPAVLDEERKPSEKAGTTEETASAEEAAAAEAAVTSEKTIPVEGTIPSEEAAAVEETIPVEGAIPAEEMITAGEQVTAAETDPALEAWTQACIAWWEIRQERPLCAREEGEKNA